MKRALPYLLLLTLAASATGQEASPDLAPIENLRYLTESPLQGETNPPTTPVTNFDTLKGKMVIKVTADDAPVGFEPVSDADIPLGIPFNAAVVRRAVVRLWDTGSYRDVQIYARAGPGDSVWLLIEVKPMLRMRKLEITGNKAMDDDEIARAVQYATDRTILPDPEVLRKLRRRLIKAYENRGYKESHVSLRIETTNEPGGVALVVEVEEGEPERYTRIRIPGLPEELAGKNFVASIGLEKDMVRNRERVEKCVRNLEERLALEGYRDARVKQFRERGLDRYKIELVIPIEAGIRTDFVFIGNEHFRTKEIEEKLIGDGLLRTSPESLSLGIGRLKKYYRTHGFFHIRIRARRHCFDEKDQMTRVSLQKKCGSRTSRQRILFDIGEGPSVEVVQILFEGNEFFSDENLEQEIFAFMQEKNAQESIFQPLTTESVDDLGISDKRPSGTHKPSGAKAPRMKQARTYVPELYRESTGHLTELYQERGFLEVHTSDTCPIEDQDPLESHGMQFFPLEIVREGDDLDMSLEKQSTPCVLINKDRDQLVVLITIEEGAQTLLNEITFEGNFVFPARVLQEIAGLSVSDPYNEYRLRESSGRLANFYRSHGYMFVESNFDKSFSSDMERARVVFTIREGPQVRAGRIRIEGAEMTSKRLIRERLVIEPGDLVTPDKIEESQQRLMELGILDSATVQMVSPDTASEIKNLKVQVSEGKPQYLELRGGMATVEGLRGGFEYGYRNLAGWAVNARLRVRANYRLFFFGNESPVISAFEEHYNSLDLDQKIEHHVSAGVGQPHLPGTKGLLGWGIDVIKERLNEPAFSADHLTGFLRLNTTHALGMKFRRAFTAELRTGLELSELQVLALKSLLEGEEGSEESAFNNPVYLPYLRLPDGSSLFWVTGLKLTLDFRDHPFNPTKGILISLGGDLVRSLSGFKPEYYDPETTNEIDNIDDMSQSALEEALASGEIYRVDKLSKLIRAQATISGYIPFGETDMVLALSATVGYIFHLTDNSVTWANRYFYAGGIDTLRGFPEESLVPEDIYQDWKSTLQDSSEAAGDLLKSSGGEAMFIARAEFRYPLAKGFYGAFFSEVGNLWREQRKIDFVDLNPLRINLRPVAGGGVRYLTPLGPLSFDLGVNLFRRPHEALFAWYLSIGTAF